MGGRIINYFIPFKVLLFDMLGKLLIFASFIVAMFSDIGGTLLLSLGLALEYRNLFKYVYVRIFGYPMENWNRGKTYAYTKNENGYIFTTMLRIYDVSKTVMDMAAREWESFSKRILDALASDPDIEYSLMYLADKCYLRLSLSDRDLMKARDRIIRAAGIVKRVLSKAKVGVEFVDLPIMIKEKKVRKWLVYALIVTLFVLGVRIAVLYLKTWLLTLASMLIIGVLYYRKLGKGYELDGYSLFVSQNLSFTSNPTTEDIATRAMWANSGLVGFKGLLAVVFKRAGAEDVSKLETSIYRDYEIGTTFDKIGKLLSAEKKSYSYRRIHVNRENMYKVSIVAYGKDRDELLRLKSMLENLGYVVRMQTPSEILRILYPVVKR